MANNIALRPSYWACVSGGKDSLYMLYVILRNLDKYPLDGVVHYELEIDYPFIKNVIDYMQSECERHGVRFVRIKPRKSWYELYKKNGFPTRVMRWCNGHYKMDCVKQLREFLKQFGCELISYIGYCADEIKRYEKRNNNRERYPLVEEKIEEWQILEWAKQQAIFNDFYKYNRRCGCMFCPMQSRRSLAYLLKYYPDKYAELMSMIKATEEKNTKKYGRFCGVFGKDISAEYVNKTIVEKYLPMLEDEILYEQTSLF